MATLGKIKIILGVLGAIICIVLGLLLARVIGGELGGGIGTVSGFSGAFAILKRLFFPSGTQVRASGGGVDSNPSERVRSGIDSAGRLAEELGRSADECRADGERIAGEVEQSDKLLRNLSTSLDDAVEALGGLKRLDDADEARLAAVRDRPLDPNPL